MQSVLVVTLLSVWMVPALGGSGGTITKTYSAYCPSHSLPHGSIEIVSGGVHNYSCHYGYRLEGHSKNYCQVDGSWTYSIPECKEMMCPAVSAPARASILGIRGGSAQRQYWPHESAVQYSCADGYELVGSPQLSCMAGEWQGEEPQCEETTCKVPVNVLTTLEYSRSESASVYEMALFSCPEGEVLSGDDMAFCGQDGRWDWSERPRCINCEHLHDRHPKDPKDHIIPRDGSCYRFVDHEESHSKAKEICEEDLGHLVTIDDQDTNDWLFETATKKLDWTNNGMWIGVEWKHTGWSWGTKVGHWTWQNGDRAIFQNWQGCLTCLGSCATMRLNDGGKWERTPCSYGWTPFKYYYVCEIPAQ